MGKEQYSGAKEMVGDVGVAGGVVGGAVALLEASSGLFIVSLLAFGGGLYLKHSNK